MYAADGEYGRLAGAGPHLVKRARAVARGFLRVLVPGGGVEAESVLLVVSELVTNAVRHAGGMTGFGLRAGPGTVAVTVEDASCEVPRAGVSKPDGTGGFGWSVVQDLAQEVQVRTHPQGKAVTAVLALPHVLPL
ncbi:ATP-binding protein [Streptomyces sp. NPDC018019]|uniref:ATP-binding protein n=1 Tax=Streptomyces sp. NPDC018019 TaxID=3365030 RepID=UPI0037A20228